MPTSQQTTNLNVSPYYDDYSPAKDYYKILFRPSRPVQARELNQTSSILQNQIQALGQNIFQSGSPVVGGGFSTNLDQDSIGVTFTNGSLSVLLNETSLMYVQSVNTGLTATVAQIIQPTATLPTFLFVNYITSGTSGSTPLFILNETCNIYVLNADGSQNLIATITCNEITQGQSVTVLAGTYFAHGYFIDTDTQTVVISPNTITTTAAVGFYVTESIVTTIQDSSLFSNAFGSPNYKAPGADRLKITLALTLRLPTDTTNVNFIELVSFQNGILQTIVDTSQYAAINDTMALRTFETNGNYVVNTFGLNILEDLQSTATPNGVYTVAAGGNINDFVSQLKPGIAYVEGYRVQNVGIQNIVEPKARTTTTALNTVTSSDYGNYILVNGMTSMPCMDITKTFNLKNSGGTIVGTTKVLSIRAGTLSSTQSASTYQLYIFNTVMSGSYNFSNVASISYSDSSNLFNANLVSAMVFNGSKNSLLFQLPYTPSQTLAPGGTVATSYSVMREYDLTTDSSGNGAITANANEVFGPIDPNTYFIAYTGAANTGVIVPITGTLTLGGSPIGRGLSIALGSTYANKAIKIIVPVDKTITTQKTKTLTSHTETLVFTNASSVNLSNADIYSLTSVIDTTSSSDVTENYSFTNGQLINCYTVGALNTVSGSPVTETVSVTYQYFAHSTGDYFTIDSYAGMARENIPTFTINGTVVSLADCFDFRPTQNAAGQITSSTFTGDVIKPTDSIRANISYYLPRKDVIYVDANGNFAAELGIPASNPILPAIPNNAMGLYDLSIPAYTADISQISQTMVDNRVYTMKDIGNLATRISNVEYYTSLNLMEASLNALQVIDPTTGNNAYKNGFASDGFTNFALSNTDDPDWGAALDVTKGICTAETVYNATDMQQASLTNGRFGSNLYTLPYTNVVASQQPYASRTSNINPYAVFIWNGDVSLSPNSDFWVDTQYVDPKVINTSTTSTINN
jgi:hypothetical protein